MSGFTPVFLQRLGLAADADEREVRRAYARELKQIDQQTQAGEFQVLREAYERALAWCRSRPAADDAPAEPAPAPTPATPADGYRQHTVKVQQARPAPRPDTDSQADTHADTHTDGQADGQADTERQSVLPDWLRLAQPVWPAFVDQVGLLGGRADAQHLEPWNALLQSTFDDPRLADLRAAPWLERQIVALLLGGWRRGHEFLWVAAAAFFNWNDDMRRLRQMGTAGHRIDLALRQYASFLQIDASQAQSLRAAIARLRDPALPNRRETERLVPQMQLVINRYPDWMFIISNVQNLQRWRDQGMQFKTTTTLAQPAAQKSGGLGWSKWGVICFALFVLQAIVRGLAPSSTPTVMPPAAPVVAASHQPSVDDFRNFQPPRPTAAMAYRIGQLLQPKIHYQVPPVLTGNPKVEFKIGLSYLGYLLWVERTVSSGLPEYDEAVRRAIESAQPYPADVPRQMLLSFRPR